MSMKFISTVSKFFFLLFLLTSTLGFAQQEKSKAKLLDPAYMDLTVKPGDDFMNYSGGIWIKNNPVPAKETTWGSFSVLRDFNVKAVREIVNEAAADKNAVPGSVKRRVGDFYSAAMDSLGIEKAGFSPIASDYARAGAVQNVKQVLEEITFQRTQGIGTPLFGVFVGQDRKHPEIMAAQLSQGGISMGDRDYYLKSDARTNLSRTSRPSDFTSRTIHGISVYWRA